jgi:hypothetical protein
MAHSQHITLTALVAITACHDDGGLTLRVFPASTETQVLVLVSDRPCSIHGSNNPDKSDACLDGIADRPNSAKISGTVRFLTDDSASDYPTVDAIASDNILELDSAGQTIRILPRPGDDGSDTRIALIGLDNGSAVSFAEIIGPVPAKPTYDQVTLTSLRSGGPMVTRWLGPSGRYSCVDIARPGDLTEFFVPSADPDCDEVLLPEECDPYAYMFSGSAVAEPGPGVASCANSDTTIGAPVCALEQFVEAACTDGTMPPGTTPTTCMPTFGSNAPCVPTAMCAPGCDSLQASCFGSGFSALDGSAFGHIDCALAFDGSAGSGTPPCEGILVIPGTVIPMCSVSLATPMDRRIDIASGAPDGFGSSAQFVDGNFNTPDPPVVVLNGSNGSSTCGAIFEFPPSVSPTMDGSGNLVTLGYARVSGVVGPGYVLPMIVRQPPKPTIVSAGCLVLTRCTLVRDTSALPDLSGCAGLQ